MTCHAKPILRRQCVPPPFSPPGRCRRQGARASSEEEKQAYAWFDGLGFPDLSKCKYVRVATGDCLQWNDEPPQNFYIEVDPIV
jgi:hypothetical protein